MKRYTSSEILAENEFPAWADDFGTHGGIKYKLTLKEYGWLKFVRGRYSIADYIDANTDKYGVSIFDMFEFSKALDDDCKGFGKAVCLSDDTALQKIFFYGYIEGEN